MSNVYDIYEHATKGAWGVSVQGTTVTTAEVVCGGLVRQGNLQPHNLAPEVSKRLRLGYKKLTKRKYLRIDGEQEGQLLGGFQQDNPELFSPGELVFFTPLLGADDVALLASQWEIELEKTDMRPEAVEVWINRIRRSCVYVAVPKTHPAIALVIADWAISNGRMLLGGKDGVPEKAPKEDPIAWQEWLKSYFLNAQQVRDALEQLGWTFRNAFLANQTVISSTSEGTQGWLVDVSAASF